MTAKAIAGDVDVVEIGRNPAKRRMAVVAVIATGNMTGVLAGRDSTVVTGRTDTDHLRMVNPVGRGKDDVVMTVLTHVGRQNMCRVLADGLGAVMAAEAVVDDCGMIEGRRYPAVGRVAVVTRVAARNVRWILASGSRAVVTG